MEKFSAFLAKVLSRLRKASDLIDSDWVIRI